MRTLYKASRKTWKTLFFHTFSERHANNSKIAVFRILWELCTEGLENVKNTVLCTLFEEHRIQTAQKCCFFAFTKEAKKHCFLTLFAESRAKRSRNAFFLHFMRTLYKVTRKTWKTLFLILFCGTSCRKLKNVFLQFMRTLYKVSRKTWKNTVFSLFLRNVVQKAQKSCFLAFYAIFVQSVTKNV